MTEGNYLCCLYS